MAGTKSTFQSICVQEVEIQIPNRPTQMPIVASSSFRFDTIDQGISIFKGEMEGDVYGRYGNPTVRAVEQKIALMEGFETGENPMALLVSSGMAAISTLLLSVLKPGDKILTQGNLYGGTTDLFSKVLKELQLEPIFTNLKDLEAVEKILKTDKTIRMLYFETPANPTLECVPIKELAALARAAQVTTVVDNTFCTPYLQRPLGLGVDFVIHSTTKYLNGHGNSIAGAIIGRDAQKMKEKVWTHMKLMGTNSNPFDAWLLNMGMKTLSLRMDQHTRNAQQIAEFLQGHESVNHVNYPGLVSHPDYQLAQLQMEQAGGMLSFELKGGITAGIKFMNEVKFCKLAPTLGDVDTLILHPASMSHVNVSQELRERNGITDGLIRLSVGIEAAADIIYDLDQALQAVSS